MNKKEKGHQKLLVLKCKIFP